jgi:Asp-tRNA(Asn)/Glu-tRNA(Gln) amidotransferase C subunit
MTFSANVRKDSITSSCLHHQQQLIHANVDESLDRFARVDRIAHPSLDVR